MMKTVGSVLVPTTEEQCLFNGKEIKWLLKLRFGAIMLASADPR